MLRSFKRTGDNPKQVVVRRGDEVAVFCVGSDTQSIRTHGLYLPLEPDTIRGTPSLVRKLNVVERVHLCRNLACTEDAAEHFTEYGVVKEVQPGTFPDVPIAPGSHWVRTPAVGLDLAEGAAGL